MDFIKFTGDAKHLLRIWAPVRAFMSQPYTRRFFAQLNDGAHRFAMVILPIVFKHAIIN
jgi:hypothetical protein